jgi:hypothetical protein
MKTFGITIEAEDAADFIRALEYVLDGVKQNRAAIDQMAVDEMLAITPDTDLCRHA